MLRFRGRVRTKSNLSATPSEVNLVCKGGVVMRPGMRFGLSAVEKREVEALRFLLHEGFPNSFRNISASLQDTKASFC